MSTEAALQLVSPGSRPAPKRDIVTRWGGDAAIMANGYVAVPVHFLMKYAAMKPFCLTVPEAMFVVQVMAFKWDEKAPFPGYKKVAARMGISEAYARKLARGLEGKGFLRRVARVGSTNAFDFQPLFDKLLPHAKAEGEVVRAMTPEAAA